MKSKFPHKPNLLAALCAVLLSTPAFADDAADIAALKVQVGKLMQQIEQLSSRQDAATQKQQAIEARVAASPESSPVGSGFKPVTSRFGGVDVRLFGSFDVYYENQHTGIGTVNRLASSGSGYTQLGFDARRALANGITAFGDVRLSYQTDNGKTNSTSRTFNTATVGFTSDTFGTLQAGRMGTQVGEALSSFRLVRLGTGNFIYNPFTTLTHDNVIKYTSPAFSNIRVSGNVDFGENANTQRKGSGGAAMVKYDDGTDMALAGVFSTYAPTDIATATDRVTIYTLGASHDFKVVKPFLVMQKARSQKSPRSLDQTGWYLGADAPVGPGTLRLESEMVRNSAWEKANAKSLNLRYDWLLAPSTTIYLTYTKIWNDDNVYYPIVGTGGFAAVAAANTNPLNPSFNTSLNGKDPSGLGVGVKFDF